MQNEEASRPCEVERVRGVGHFEHAPALEEITKQDEGVKLSPRPMLKSLVMFFDPLCFIISFCALRIVQSFLMGCK